LESYNIDWSIPKILFGSNLCLHQLLLGAYNCDLRDRKKKHTTKKIEIKECNFENGMNLSKKMIPRGQLMQGFWQTESMIKELRHYEEHWRKGGTRDFLHKELSRKIFDPLSKIETVGNLIILSGILLLMSYNMIEVLQTWIDTHHIIKK
jgi:hypothetical protein